MAKQLPIRRRDFATAQFAGWLAANGAEIGVPTNPYEVVRYRAYGQESNRAETHIVYAKDNGLLTFTGSSRSHYSRFMQNEPLAGNVFLVPKASRVRGDSRGEKRREKLLARDGDECWFCGLAMGEDCTLEHLVPKSKGGGDRLDNFALAHRLCNNRAADLPLVQKIELRTKLRAASDDERAKRQDPEEGLGPKDASAVPAEERADAHPSTPES